MLFSFWDNTVQPTLLGCVVGVTVFSVWHVAWHFHPACLSLVIALCGKKAALMYWICMFALHTTPSEMMLICFVFYLTMYAMLWLPHIICCCIILPGTLGSDTVCYMCIAQRLGECMTAPCHAQFPFPRAACMSLLQVPGTLHAQAHDTCFISDLFEPDSKQQKLKDQTVDTEMYPKGLHWQVTQLQ